MENTKMIKFEPVTPRYDTVAAQITSDAMRQDLWQNYPEFFFLRGEEVLDRMNGAAVEIGDWVVLAVSEEHLADSCGVYTDESFHFYCKEAEACE